MKKVLLNRYFLITLLVSLPGFLPAQTTLFYDNCNNMANWTNTGGFYQSITNNLLSTSAVYNWQSVDPIIPPDDHTVGGNCFYTNGNSLYMEAGAGQNYILYRIQSNPINLSGYDNCRLEFWMQMRSETGNWDGGFLEWSHDGITWTKITNAQLCSTGGMYYDGNMSQNGASTPFYFLTTPAWFNYRTTWTRMLVNISAFDNVPAFRLRYTFHSDQLSNEQGWTIDDIRIVSIATPVVRGNSIIIPDNDITPVLPDGTDWGNVGIGFPIIHTFYIHNTGESPLQLTGVPLVTTTGTGFSVVVQPPTNVVPVGDSLPFQVQFDPLAVGVINGTVTIPNGDNYSSCTPPNPYNYAIRANGIIINTPPFIINPPADTFVCPNTLPVVIPFNINDNQQAPAVLTLSGTSSNPAVVAPGGIVFGGAAAARNITITPVAGAIGSSTITITVNDGQPINFDSTFSFVITLGDTISPVASCQDVQVQLDASGNGSLTATLVNNGSTDNCGIDNITISQTAFTCADAGPQLLDFTVTDVAGNISICQFTATVLPAPLVNTFTVSNYNGYNISCAGGNDGSINVATSAGCTPYTYVWQHDPALTGNIANNLTAGNYQVTVTDAVGQQEVLLIQLTEPPAMQNTSTSLDVSCFGLTDGSVSLNAVGGVPPYIYSQGPAITGLPDGTYNYTITDDNGCIIPVSVTIIEPIGIDITGQNKYFVYCGDAIPFDIHVAGGSAPYTYSWDNASSLSCGDCEDPASTPSKSTIYTISVTDSRGCTQFYSVSVEVDCNVFVPNSFTPNADGINEIFLVRTGQPLEFRMDIYDRWGEEVFHSDDPAKGWDGNYKNTGPAPQGVYVYDIFLKMPNSDQINLKGKVNLLR